MHHKGTYVHTVGKEQEVFTVHICRKPIRQSPQSCGSRNREPRQYQFT